ncbi:MAG: hypothetical protein Q7R31_01155 [Candidatus Levybacteria bacterium]|nr:hypothetical protein [Candidatus Levybacteria bacterium]
MDFQFLQNPISKKWVILSPRRAKRPDIAKGFEPVCPFCPGREKEEKEVYRVGGNDNDSGWQIRVLPNKFPFAPIHEVIVHSPDHHKNFGELPLSAAELIINTYRQRYDAHKDKGQVYIFHNHGEGGGESLPHPHTQLAVIPSDVKMDVPTLASNKEAEAVSEDQITQETKEFIIFCPKTSQWPDEVWISPRKRGRLFGEISDGEVSDLAFTLSRLVQILDLRHGNEFPFNFYIYQGGDWYLRIIPRVKSLGGFEVGTGVFINTQDSQETINFIKEHFENPDEEKIKTSHSATYRKGV